MAERFKPFFGEQPGVVWAADVTPEEFAPIMEQIGDTPGLVGVKIGFELGLGLSLKECVQIVRANSDAKIQYDHQKAANDIPDTSINFVRAMVGGGVDSAILFPFTGPETQTAWTRGLQEEGINVFTGADMTHKRFRKKEGGSIPETSLAGIYDLALDLGVNDFIVPGNQGERIRKWRRKFETARGVGKFAVAAPGFINQGGNISAAAKAAGRYWHPIIGRGIHANERMTPQQAVDFYATQHQLNQAA